ncbi:hypothetical protein JCM10450v2_003758 [Rhodotorula kratochvilovae]
MTLDSSDAPIHLAVTHGGRTVPVSLAASSSLAHLSAHLAAAFNLAPASLKLLLKGKKLPLDPADPSAQQRLGSVLAALLDPAVVAAASSPSAPLKALLVGTPAQALDALHAVEALRARKHAAFAHHEAHRAPRARAAGVHSLAEGGNDGERYRFHALEPFPERVPQFEKRQAMLRRLAEDPAVRDVMKRHEFAVGMLTELHPLLQPTLLGLNTNAGEKVALRLLTDQLDGLRSYSDVRRVLLHELAHNRFGPHDNDFKELNSLLNREVASFESSPSFEPWDPSSSSSSAPAPEAHKLNEEEAERVWDQLRFGLEEEVEMRRERAGRAAEERARRARGEA